MHTGLNFQKIYKHLPPFNVGNLTLHKNDEEHVKDLGTNPLQGVGLIGATLELGPTLTSEGHEPS